MRIKPSARRIVIVGPCGSGKSTLASALQTRGYHAYQVAQEHSFSPSMWHHLTKPDLLIYLDASYEVCTQRKNLDWLPHEYSKQTHRLRHARQHCHIYLRTDTLTPEEVFKEVISSEHFTPELPEQSNELKS